WEAVSAAVRRSAKRTRTGCASPSALWEWAISSPRFAQVWASTRPNKMSLTSVDRFGSLTPKPRRFGKRWHERFAARRPTCRAPDRRDRTRADVVLEHNASGRYAPEPKGSGETG